MTDAATIKWLGQSGKEYQYWIYPIGHEFIAQPGNYIFARRTSPGQWTPVYIGETGSLVERLRDHEKLPCVKRNNGTHIHVHKSSADVKVRRVEEADLIARWNPPCNEE